MKKRSILAIIAAITMMTGVSAQALTATYTPMGAPDINSSFKTYMDYRCITSTSNPQYKYIKQWGWVDGEGFMRANGERELGIPEDYYMVAMGSYYGTGIGTKYRITLNTGRVIYAVLCDQKADCDTDCTHRYSYNNDVLEFIVDTRSLNSNVKLFGSANVYMPLNGIVSQVERISFVEEN